MNKKLLFAAISLAALTACTSDDFESKKVSVAEEVSPVQIELINVNDAASTRATMNENTIAWQASQGDLFTLYHGGVGAGLSGFQNATYKASEGEGGAVLTTPSMILAGEAIMVWPADTTFRIGSAANLTIKIPAEQKNIVNNIPYVSDRFTIGAYGPYKETAPGKTDYNTAGKDRKYTVYMRPMASQLTIKADYAGTDATLGTLYTGDDAIGEISVKSVDLLTNAGTEFTTEIPVAWGAANGGVWNAPAATATANQTWSAVTTLNVGGIVAAGKTLQLTAKEDCLDGNNGCKILLLPQAAIGVGANAAGAAVVVNTIYGKVVVAPNAVQGSEYAAAPTAEDADAWYRYVPAGVAIDANETRDATKKNDKGWDKVYSKIADGMRQTINDFNIQTAPTGSKVQGEPIGAATTRYVKVLLNHLDMTNLHIDNDKWLRDAARVWQKMGLSSATVYLDGDASGKFEISQQTIKTINDINAAATGGKFFHVQPCNVTGEICNTIVITGASEIQKIQDMTFITNGTKTADVELKAGETWKWDGSVTLATAATTGVKSIINKGTLVNDADKILKIQDNTKPTAKPLDIPVVNDGTWNITAGTIRVQNNVTNNGTVNISKGAQYRQDGAWLKTLTTPVVATFTNEASTKEKRFNGGTESIGVVNNEGVFAAVADGEIHNFSLIDHKDMDAKTYITHNQKGGVFTSNFSGTNKMGRINLPYDNKDEDNISISAVTNMALMEGFVSVTVDESNAPSTTLNNTAVGEFVNSIIVNGGINEISNLASQIKYVEINEPGKEIAWNLIGTTKPVSASYTGLTVLSDVNIKLGTQITATVTYLDAKATMYVGGKFNDTTTQWNGYFGNTAGNVPTNYVTF